jgi:4-hydroxy-3-polyprenylbenzoate decarboxylase
MCIDGSAKYEEEIEDNYAWLPAESNRFDDLKLQYPEITGINTSLLEIGIPCLLLSVEKNKKGHIRELHESICKLHLMESIKMILYIEHTIDVQDLTVALWRFCNNLDPRRDHFLVQRQSINDNNKIFACIGFDGTRKTKEWDNFQRDWPNVIVANDETIRSVDEKWSKLGLGTFLPSPSLKFKAQIYGEEAIVSN